MRRASQTQHHALSSDASWHKIVCNDQHGSCNSNFELISTCFFFLCSLGSRCAKQIYEVRRCQAKCHKLEMLCCLSWFRHLIALSNLPAGKHQAGRSTGFRPPTCCWHLWFFSASHKITCLTIFVIFFPRHKTEMASAVQKTTHCYSQIAFTV